MKATSLARWAGGAVIAGSAVTLWRFGCASNTLNLTGLGLDIVGAVILTVSATGPRAAYYRIADRTIVRGDRGFLRWWILEWPLALASVFGSKRAEGEYIEDTVRDGVSGLTFLVLGFGLQAVAQAIQVIR